MDIATVVEKQFRPAPHAAGKIGAEVELVAVTDSLWPQAVDPATLAAGFDASFVRAARPSFEPGGQLELSPAPRRSARRLIADLDGLIRHAAAIAEAQGVRRGLRELPLAGGPAGRDRWRAHPDLATRGPATHWI
jgi:glutamate--cysteine ligase